MADTSQLVEQRKQELLSYVQDFYRKSWDWRSQRMHERWNKCDRNFNGIYDPNRLAQKEEWQSTMFIDITFQNVEIITSQIYKTMMAPNPAIQTQAGPAGDDLQARLIQDVVDYQLRKSKFDLAFYDALKEAVKYGSGFVKLYWEKVEDLRVRRIPVEQTPQEVIQSAPPESLVGQMPLPSQGIKGFQMLPVPVLLRNSLCAKWVHIRDIFPEPNTTTWEKVIHRDKISYGEIVNFIQKDQFFDVRDKLQDVTEGEHFEQDIQDIKQERGYFEVNRSMPRNEKRHTVWEMYNSIPRKWIQFDIPDGDYAEELVPAKVMVASGVALLSSEINAQFDGENPVLKFDYIRTGETYGKGVPEVLFDDQDEINESGNLGIDNMNLIMNKMIAVNESSLVNPEQDLVSKPGAQIRLKGNVEDVRKAVMPIEFSDLVRSFFEHRFNIERMVQEKTGANRVTLGSSGLVKDTNQTLGGMELLKQMFNERVAAYGMVMESSFLIRTAERIYGLIYQNLGHEDLRPILGDDPVTIQEIPGQMPVQVPRYLAFAFVPPEEVGRSYRFKPMGVFSLENKVVKVAQFMDYAKVFAPVLNMSEAAKYVAELMGTSEKVDRMILPMPIMPPGAPTGAPNLDKKDIPGAKGGPNGNQPSFLPPNPLRREPVAP
jgi:superoxide dismutase